MRINELVNSGGHDHDRMLNDICAKLLSTYACFIVTGSNKTRIAAESKKLCTSTGKLILV